MKFQEKICEIRESIGGHVNDGFVSSPGKPKSCISKYTTTVKSVIIWVIGWSRDYHKNKIWNFFRMVRKWNVRLNYRIIDSSSLRNFRTVQNERTVSKWANTINIWQIIIKLILKVKRLYFSFNQGGAFSKYPSVK